MSIGAKIIEAQRAILDRLIEWEELVGRLYNRYAMRFTDYDELWLTLAAEEREHADALREVRALLDWGHVLEGVGEFTGGQVDDEFAFAHRELKRARQRVLPLSDAIRTAREIEASMIESRFFDTVQCRAPRFEAIAARMRQATERHREKLRRLRA